MNTQLLQDPGAIEILDRMHQHLQSICEGSSAKGRWLDAGGTECDPEAEGAHWEPYTAEEQSMWLDTVVAHTAAVIGLGHELKQRLAGQTETDDAERLSPCSPRG